MNGGIIASREPGQILDAFGVGAALLCAVHCASMPIVIALLPLLGLGFSAVESAEYPLVGLSATLGVTSLCLGYRRHRSRRALAVLAGGLTLLVLGRVAEACGAETVGVVPAVLGGCFVAVAHLTNRRLCRTCGRCRWRDASGSIEWLDPNGGTDRP
ncbi:MAG: MerC domain-containing protein [Isosphaeraceae bacterium]